jgi:hypothetical protein
MAIADSLAASLMLLPADIAPHDTDMLLYADEGRYADIAPVRRSGGGVSAFLSIMRGYASLPC